MDFYIKEYGKRLFGLCMTLCRNRSDAEDLYQDTWLRVMANIERYHPDQPFEPWLTTICVNLYRNSLRRITHSPIFNTFSSNEEKDQRMEQVPAADLQDYSDLHNAIQRLSDKLRIVVILYYFQGMDIQSTAKVLHIPEGTVKSRMNKAKQQLKEELQNAADF